jgi:hypothetical protein
MKRREFISLLGGAVAWPLAARRSRGRFRSSGSSVAASPDTFAPFVAGFHQGLRETGYSEGQNLAVEYRWAFGQYDRLPALAADLVGHRVAILVTCGRRPVTSAIGAYTGRWADIAAGPSPRTDVRRRPCDRGRVRCGGCHLRVR